VQHTLEHATEAQQLLHAVLALTHVQGDVRLFLDEGEPVATLLAQSVAFRLAQEPSKAQNNPIYDYCEQLLAAFEGHAAARDVRHVGQRVLCPALAGSTALVEPLSPQEQRVLRLLRAGFPTQRSPRSWSSRSTQ